MLWHGDSAPDRVPAGHVRVLEAPRSSTAAGSLAVMVNPSGVAGRRPAHALECPGSGGHIGLGVIPDPPDDGADPGRVRRLLGGRRAVGGGRWAGAVGCPELETQRWRASDRTDRASGPTGVGRGTVSRGCPPARAGVRLQMIGRCVLLPPSRPAAPTQNFKILSSTLEVGRLPGTHVGMTLTATEVRALPAVVDVVTAAQALGIGRTVAYELVRTGHFPTPVLRVGRQIKIPTSYLVDLLGLSTNPPATPPGPTSTS